MKKFIVAGTKSRPIKFYIKYAYVTALSNPRWTALTCSVESLTSFRPQWNASHDREANRNWLGDIPRERENRRGGTDLAERGKWL